MASTTSLAPYAVPIEGRLGRAFPEEPDETRNAFQRDRDRILHCNAFRRLQGKTQVFDAGESDHVRTRLTHTLEVAQIGSDIARRLGLNEDLVECIALAHDLGHPPFGHSGEEALDAWSRSHGGRFEHNEQGIRIVTLLERRSSRYPGLNLDHEVVEGMDKHAPRSHLLEAQLVNLCDEVAYTSHDCDDGIRADVFSLKDVLGIPLAAQAWERASARGTRLRGSLIHLLAEDLFMQTQRELRERNIRTLEDVDRATDPIVRFSQSMRGAIEPLRAFLRDNLYAHVSVASGKEEGKRIVRSLCESYLQNPSAKIVELQERTGSPLFIAVKDYVAGMTDTYARAAARV